MDRENPFRGYPRSNSSLNSMSNPNVPAPEPYTAASVSAEGNRTAADYHTAYEPLASQLARLSLDQRPPPPLFPNDILQQLRIQSATQSTPPPQNYQNFDSYNRNGLLINDANLYNSLLMNGEAGAAVNYNTSRRLNGDALNFYNSRGLNDGGDSLYYVSPRPRLNGLLLHNSLNNKYDARFQYESEIQMNNFNRNIVGRSNTVPVSRPRQQQQQQRPNLVPLQEMRGKIVTVAKDQFGCRFLQNKFAEGNPDDIQMVFSEIKDHIYELVVHQFGNYLVSKFVEVCNQEQMTQLLMLVINDDRKFADICADMYGYVLI